MFAMQKAVPGSNNAVSTKGSKTIALGFSGSDQSPISISGASKPFYFSIPLTATLPDFVPIYNPNTTAQLLKIQMESNTTSTKPKGPINLLLLNGFSVTKKNVSIHYYIEPTDETLGYFAAMKFGGNPYLNSTYQRYDVWKIFCPWGIKLMLIKMSI
jgi:hypothetical protein